MENYRVYRKNAKVRAHGKDENPTRLLLNKLPIFACTPPFTYFIIIFPNISFPFSFTKSVHPLIFSVFPILSLSSCMNLWSHCSRFCVLIESGVVPPLSITQILPPPPLPVPFSINFSSLQSKCFLATDLVSDVARTYHYDKKTKQNSNEGYSLWRRLKPSIFFSGSTVQANTVVIYLVFNELDFNKAFPFSFLKVSCFLSCSVVD